MLGSLKAAIRLKFVASALLGTAVVGGTVPASARVDGSPQAVHPIFARVQDAPQNDLALGRFSAATARFGLGPVEVVDIDGDPAPRAAEKLRAGIDLVRKLAFGPALTILDDAAAEVAATGGGGLDALALSDLFLFRAWTISRADFNTDHVTPLTARTSAYAELLRAAMATPTRQLNQQQYPPLLLEDFARAVTELASRPQGTLIVHAAPESFVTCDGGAPVPGPATFVGLAQGDHLIHIDEPGWASWGATLSVNAPTVEMQVPPRRALTLDDVVAAAHARRMGTRFALVAEPRPGQDGGLSIAFRLVDAGGARVDAAVAPLAGDPGILDSAVMRLDEQARRLDRVPPLNPPAVAAASTDSAGAGAAAATMAALPPAVLLAPPPPRPRLSENPSGWARDHWPLLTAVGAMVGTALVLSISVAADRPAR